MLITEKSLGNLCARGHDHENTGKSLRYSRSVGTGWFGGCIECAKIVGLNNRAKNPSKYRDQKSRYRDNNRAVINQKARAHYAANADRIRATHREYYHGNSKKVIAQQRVNFDKDRLKKYRWQNKYMKQQRANNTQLAIGVRLRFSVYQAFRKYTTTGKIMVSSKYGIDYGAIISRLGPHPNTLGIKGKFHIDHIIPVSFFDLNDPEQVLIAFAPENHQWLLAGDNRLKGDKVPPIGEIPIEILTMLGNQNIGLEIHA